MPDDFVLVRKILFLSSNKSQPFSVCMYTQQDGRITEGFFVLFFLGGDPHLLKRSHDSAN